MSAVKSLMLQVCSVFAAAAVFVVQTNVNSTCCFTTHQPKLPDGASKFCRVK